MARAAVLTVSDSRAAGARADESTALIAGVLAAAEIEVVTTRLVGDEHDDIAAALVELAASADLVLTCGGTGLAPRDVTPEATRSILDREAPGLAEAMRAETARITPQAWLSRAVAGQRGRALIVNLPGSPKGAIECLEVLLPLLPHALAVGEGGGEGGHAHGR
ncbi:MAG: MogA/MoaB family molybdenum cofactor biosynthesis protein [Solirubrobacterales bacterium]|nr:MogA/MoaB family molybdenum cofactor biosynthesis protein [Solirubrobacterales bacterium]